MLTIFKLFAVAIGLFSLQSLTAQINVHSYTSGEIIFSQSDASFTQEFKDTYSSAQMIGNNVRFTLFFHLGQYWHFDFTDNIGLISGLGIRNVGMITDERLPQFVIDSDNPGNLTYEDYKIIRRQYMLGVPLMVKLGSFNKHFYFFGGAEMEWAFHFKQKYWTGTTDRSGDKTKSTEWFSNRTPNFLPSVVGGVQLPGGLNLRFKYYLTDFLNHDYAVPSNSQAGSTFNVGDLTRYETSQLFYLSVCWQFDYAEMKD
jgi:hypothetical protein